MTSTTLITLDEWASLTYGEKAPCMATLRRWCREGFIYPAPEKHGRAYFLQRSARYIHGANTELLNRIRKDRHDAKAA